MKFDWKIKCFAGLPERLGLSEIHIQTSVERLTVTQLKQAISELYPEHTELIQIAFLACNHAYAAEDTLLNTTDELALLPPVSGGEETLSEPQSAAAEQIERYIITSAELHSDDVLAKVIVPEHGASIVFVGTTREWTHGQRTVRLEYEAYAPMAITTMQQIGDEIADRWPGAICAISHRIGVVDIAETSVIIAVSSPHRDSCYDASRYAIERLKQIVPIWKKEIWEDGSEWKGHQLGPWNPTAPLTHF